MLENIEKINDSDVESQNTSKTQKIDNSKVNVLIVSLGGGGGNITSNVIETIEKTNPYDTKGLNVDYLVLNTDEAKDLGDFKTKIGYNKENRHYRGDMKVIVIKSGENSYAHGAGMDHSKAEKWISQGPYEDQIKDYIYNRGMRYQFILIIASVGGGTGSGLIGPITTWIKEENDKMLELNEDAQVPKVGTILAKPESTELATSQTDEAQFRVSSYLNGMLNGTKYVDFVSVYDNDTVGDEKQALSSKIKLLEESIELSPSDEKRLMEYKQKLAEIGNEDMRVMNNEIAKVPAIITNFIQSRGSMISIDIADLKTILGNDKKDGGANIVMINSGVSKYSTSLDRQVVKEEEKFYKSTRKVATLSRDLITRELDSWQKALIQKLFKNPEEILNENVEFITNESNVSNNPFKRDGLIVNLNLSPDDKSKILDKIKSGEGLNLTDITPLLKSFRDQETKNINICIEEAKEKQNAAIKNIAKDAIRKAMSPRYLKQKVNKGTKLAFNIITDEEIAKNQMTKDYLQTFVLNEYAKVLSVSQNDDENDKKVKPTIKLGMTSIPGSIDMEIKRNMNIYVSDLDKMVGKSAWTFVNKIIDYVNETVKEERLENPMAFVNMSILEHLSIDSKINHVGIVFEKIMDFFIAEEEDEGKTLLQFTEEINKMLDSNFPLISYRLEATSQTDEESYEEFKTNVMESIAGYFKYNEVNKKRAIALRDYKKIISAREKILGLKNGVGNIKIEFILSGIEDIEVVPDSDNVKDAKYNNGVLIRSPKTNSVRVDEKLEEFSRIEKVEDQEVKIDLSSDDALEQAKKLESEEDLAVDMMNLFKNTTDYDVSVDEVNVEDDSDELSFDEPTIESSEEISKTADFLVEDEKPFDETVDIENEEITDEKEDTEESELPSFLR